MKSDICIEERFEKEIVLHVLRVLYTDNAPLILAISGPAGEGKTYQCKIVLERMGIKVFPLSAGQFENKEAGEPARLVKDTYEEAVKYMKKSSTNAAAILIDDADVALGDWGEKYQYTVNTQNVIGELMNLADAPAKNNKEDIRIPIFMTGNDLKRLYYPLRRSGRMNFFYWKPNQLEKANMIFYLFHTFSKPDCLDLVNYINKYCKESNIEEMPISFYSDLAAYKFDDDLWKQYCTIKETCLSGGIIDKIHIPIEESDLTLATLKSIAVKQIKEIKNSKINHNKEESKEGESDGHNLYENKDKNRDIHQDS